MLKNSIYKQQEISFFDYPANTYIKEDLQDDSVTINNQVPIKITSDSKGVRYDVYVEDENNSLSGNDGP